jgi:hypothetical protein
MDANLGYPHCEIEVRGHRLKVHFNTMLTDPPGFTQIEHLKLQPKKLIVRLLCCGRWGQPFRARGGYYTPGECAMCHRRKTERFRYAELKPLLPAEWWQVLPQS